jgi:hypothetical protein
MEKTHKLKTLKDIGNLITDENKEFLIADIIASLEFIVDLKENVLKETGEYPTDFFDSISICFDGSVGVDKISINGNIYELNKQQ